MLHSSDVLRENRLAQGESSRAGFVGITRGFCPRAEITLTLALSQWERGLAPRKIVYDWAQEIEP